jgi:hypothetical protein
VAAFLGMRNLRTRGRRRTDLTPWEGGSATQDMGEEQQSRERYQFARLLTQIEVLRGRAVQELVNRLPPERREQIMDRLRDIVSKLTSANKK